LLRQSSVRVFKLKSQHSRFQPERGRSRKYRVATFIIIPSVIVIVIVITVIIIIIISVIRISPAVMISEVKIRLDERNRAPDPRIRTYVRKSGAAAAKNKQKGKHQFLYHFKMPPLTAV
jgi:flagellar basal body-associated protein FliL